MVRMICYLLVFSGKLVVKTLKKKAISSEKVIENDHDQMVTSCCLTFML